MPARMAASVAALLGYSRAITRSIPAAIGISSSGQRRVDEAIFLVTDQRNAPESAAAAIANSSSIGRILRRPSMPNQRNSTSAPDQTRAKSEKHEVPRSPPELAADAFDDVHPEVADDRCERVRQREVIHVAREQQCRAARRQRDRAALRAPPLTISIAKPRTASTGASWMRRQKCQTEQEAAAEQAGGAQCLRSTERPDTCRATSGVRRSLRNALWVRSRPVRTRRPRGNAPITAARGPAKRRRMPQAQQTVRQREQAQRKARRQQIGSGPQHFGGAEDSGEERRAACTSGTPSSNSQGMMPLPKASRCACSSTWIDFVGVLEAREKDRHRHAQHHGQERRSRPASTSISGSAARRGRSVRPHLPPRCRVSEGEPGTG